MKRHDPLRQLLLLDAATCAVFAAILLFGAQPLAGWLHLPSSLLFWAGAVLVPTAAFMAASAIRDEISAWAAWTIVLGNAGWVLLSIALPLSGAVEPNGLGLGFILAQAAAVNVLAVLEYRAIQARQPIAGTA